VRVTFQESAWNEYVYWQTEDKRTLKSINNLIKDIERNGFSDGLGKPERLRSVSAFSRRIDEKNRLIYRKGNDGTLEIISCKGHYDDK